MLEADGFGTPPPNIVARAWHIGYNDFALFRILVHCMTLICIVKILAVFKHRPLFL